MMVSCRQPGRTGTLWLFLVVLFMYPSRSWGRSAGLSLLFVVMTREEKLRFYHSSAWKKKRLQILARDKHACQECRKQGRYSTAVIVHHIKHLQDEPGLALTDDNLESVCKDCHEKLHPERNREKQSFVNVERW